MLFHVLIFSFIQYYLLPVSACRCKQLVTLNIQTKCKFNLNVFFSGKLTRHKVGCDKRFKEAKNQEAPHDWEPPAKIPKPINYGSRVNPGASLLNRQHHQNTALLNQAARGALQVHNYFIQCDRLGKILSGNRLDVKTSIIGFFYLPNHH